MSHTHTGDIVKESKKVAAWLLDRSRSAGAPVTEAELQTRVDVRCPKHFTDDEREGVRKAAMVLFKQKDPEGWERVIAAYAGHRKNARFLSKQICPKCKYKSGNDWTQCNGLCPMKMSPHYDPTTARVFQK